MKIIATDRLSDIQARFQALFPLLQLRFYRVGHPPGGESMKKDEVSDNNQYVADLYPNVATGEIPIHDQTTAGQLETDLARLFGLYTQVFRKAGKEWIQTTNTDSWTLDRQQAVAAETEHFFQNIRR